MTHRQLVRLALSACLISACGGSDLAAGRATGGTVIISSAAEADILLPPLVRMTSGLAVVDQIFDRLADIGPDLNTVGDAGYSPRLATGWKWGTDSLSLSFALDPRARWHDGRPVTSRDVVYSFDLYRDPSIYAGAGSFARIDSVTSTDSLGVVVWFRNRYPEQFFSATYDLRVLPSHLLDTIPRERLSSSGFARSPVGSGPFRFVKWEPDALIEIVADTSNYRGRPPLDRVIFSKAGDFNSAVTNVLSGDADFFEILRPPDLAAVGSNPEVTSAEHPSMDYVVLSFNFRDRKNTREPHPLFSDRAMRMAISLATNREYLVRSTFDTLAFVNQGPFVRSFTPAALAPEQIPYDTVRAAQILDSLGWRIPPGREIREKDGRALSFGALVISSSASRMRMITLMQEELRRLGIRLTIEDVTPPVFGSLQRAGDFDLLFVGWHVDPSPSGLLQLWHSNGLREKGGSNLGSYSNPAFDALVDSALAQFDVRRERELLQRAYQTIVDDAPAIWMYEPRMIAAIHARLRVPKFRADGWWSTIDQWSVDPEMRISRDMVGLRQPAG